MNDNHADDIFAQARAESGAVTGPKKRETLKESPFLHADALSEAYLNMKYAERDYQIIRDAVTPDVTSWWGATRRLKGADFEHVNISMRKRAINQPLTDDETATLTAYGVKPDARTTGTAEHYALHPSALDTADKRRAVTQALRAALPDHAGPLIEHYPSTLETTNVVPADVLAQIAKMRDEDGMAECLPIVGTVLIRGSKRAQAMLKAQNGD